MSGEEFFWTLTRKEQIGIIISRFNTLAQVDRSKSERDIWKRYRSRHAVRLAETLNPIIESV